MVPTSEFVYVGIGCNRNKGGRPGNQTLTLTDPYPDRDPDSPLYQEQKAANRETKKRKSEKKAKVLLLE